MSVHAQRRYDTDIRFSMATISCRQSKLSRLSALKTSRCVISRARNRSLTMADNSPPISVSNAGQYDEYMLLIYGCIPMYGQGRDAHCGICHEDISSDMKTTRHKSCGAVWCRGCLQSWVETASRRRIGCPNCRGYIGRLVTWAPHGMGLQDQDTGNLEFPFDRDLDSDVSVLYVKIAR